ncbi:MAG: hypothetical protein CML42_09880 [Rhodobacteraceae bacterium]|nr:hypothetical protein [Paracoccaceae bacterium]|tara:strand:- start:6124 stop:7008 length:885 start_codon:yes stop_codon:yes gene_type:complete
MSKNTTQCVKAKEFDCDQVTYSKPSVNKYGGKSIKLGLNGSNGLVLQFPLMLTWGVNEWPNEQTGQVKYDLALQFEPQKSSSQAKFLENMKALQNKLLEDASLNAKEWFGKNKMSKEVAEAMTWPFVKCYTRDDGSESFTMKLKIPFWENKFMVELYDTEGKPTYLMKGGEANKGSPVNLIQKGSHIVGLMKCTQISFVGGRWGISWSLVQAKVRPPQRLLGSGTCHVADDSDDEDTLETLAQKDKEADESDDDVSKPTFDDDDDDEEEEEEEVEVEPEPVKKKKKVVRRKKKT